MTRDDAVKVAQAMVGDGRKTYAWNYANYVVSSVGDPRWDEGPYVPGVLVLADRLEPISLLVEKGYMPGAAVPEWPLTEERTLPTIPPARLAVQKTGRGAIRVKVL